MRSEGPGQADPSTHRSLEEGRRGVRGSVIQVHRSLSRFQLPPTRRWRLILAPLLFTAAAWPAMATIAHAWQHVIAFWMAWLDLPGAVVLIDDIFVGIHVPLPRVGMPDVLPTRTDGWVTLGIVTCAAVMAHWLPDRATPVRYIIRVLAIIQATAVVYFWLLPDQFPHSATNHLEVILRSSVWVMLLIPWIHALVYYVFPFTLWQHLALTLLTLVALAAITPMLAVLHALLLAKATLIVLPVLYFALGVLVYVMVCIALYGWGMSWHTRNESNASHDDRHT